jgi:hypothetical protein
LFKRILRNSRKKKAEQEKKRREEEELARIAEEKRKKEEEEQKKLEELRAARRNPMVNLSNVMTNSPGQNFGINRDTSGQKSYGFKRESSTFDRRMPQGSTQPTGTQPAKATGFQRSGPSRLDRLSRLG